VGDCFSEPVPITYDRAVTPLEERPVDPLPSVSEVRKAIIPWLPYSAPDAGK